MTPEDVVEAIRARGVRLVAGKGVIFLFPPGALPADLREALRRNKPAVLEMLACSLGKGDPAPCPSCRYIHGDLSEREPCSRCGSEAWTVSLANDDGTARTCAACLRAGAGAPPATDHPKEQRP